MSNSTTGIAMSTAPTAGIDISTTTTPSYDWKFCHDSQYDAIADIPAYKYEDPLSHYYYDAAYNCYCYDWCPSFWANLPVYPSEAVARFLYAYIFPVIFGVGLIGNCLILVMFLTNELRSMASKPFFQSLALTDNIALISSLLFISLREGYFYDPLHNAASCKIKRYIANFSSCASAWLVAALTADRFVCVTWPMKANLIRLKHRAGIITLIYIILGLFYTHFLVYETFNNGGCATRQDDETYKEFLFNYWTWLDLAARFLIPFCVIVFCNVGMVYNMRKGEVTEISSTKTESQVASKRLTRLFIVISTSFVVMVLPLNVLLIMMYYFSQSEYSVSQTYRLWALDIMILAICKLVYYTNNAINFFLYCIAGRKFRVALTSLVPCTRTRT